VIFPRELPDLCGSHSFFTPRRTFLDFPVIVGRLSGLDKEARQPVSAKTKEEPVTGSGSGFGSADVSGLKEVCLAAARLLSLWLSFSPRPISQPRPPSPAWPVLHTHKRWPRPKQEGAPHHCAPRPRRPTPRKCGRSLIGQFLTARGSPAPIYRPPRLPPRSPAKQTRCLLPRS
jgi:hypothetical protein